MVVKSHLHLSSDVQEVVSSTLMPIVRRKKTRQLLMTTRTNINNSSSMPTHKLQKLINFISSGMPNKKNNYCSWILSYVFFYSRPIIKIQNSTSNWHSVRVLIQFIGMPLDISSGSWLIWVTMQKTVKFLVACQLAIRILKQHANCCTRCSV